jgi:predicted Zn-dependent protease
MKKLVRTLPLFLLSTILATAQQKATIRETTRVIKTYPFSDPDPIPEMNKIYPYFRFDGYTNTPVQKTWKVVEMENDYIKVMVMPEVGGKIWSAIEKSTGKSYIYYNHTVKFRDVGMRGPWTSGGIEPNYGIIGHTPNCATPVDFTTINRPDGSVSCIIGVLDLLTRTTWRIDINLPKDKAYLTTTSFWYNNSPLEQPYYTWMNTGIKASGNLEFVYPGNRYIGHGGEYADWPINKENGKNISFYEQNDFGGPKSYHVFGKYTDFFGGYYHDEDFGMGRYSNHDDKAGKKVWIWGLSREGMIWEKLLTDTDGQYVEVQSGRSFNQAAESSTFTPFKHKGFMPHTTDVWTEYWFPVVKTKGLKAANNYGALNIKNEDGFLKIYFSPLQKINDEFVIKDGDKVVYSKMLNLNTLQLFKDSFKLNTNADQLVATLGKNKLQYSLAPDANVISRPVQSPADFDWNSAYGLYLQGKEDIRQRYYVPAEEKLRASLQKEPYYVPALSSLAMVLYRNMQCDSALALAKRALSIDTYDEAANYYYGLINNKLGNITDARDGFDIATMGTEYRSAAYSALANIYLKTNNLPKAVEYAYRTIEYNRFAMDAYQTLAVAYRIQNNQAAATKALDSLLKFDPLNHFARFEKYLWKSTEENKKAFVSLIKNEMPRETFLEMAIWYNAAGRKSDAAKLLQLAPQNAEVLYWQAYLENKPLNTQQLHPEMVFPFRSETADVLNELAKKNDNWLLKYHLALINWNYNNLAVAKQLFQDLGNTPDFAPFYAARANFNMSNDSSLVLNDLLQAKKMDNNQWRYGKNLINFYLGRKQYAQALQEAQQDRTMFKSNFVFDMLYARALLLNKKYKQADDLLKTIEVLPSEGATGGRQLYKETKLMLAVEAMQNKNYDQALQYIDASRLWPENLGSGKPYDEDIDERLEDWMAYESYSKKGDEQAAKQMLDRIVAKAPGRRGSVNDLVTAWALQKTGKRDEAKKILNEWLEKNPDNIVAKWAVEAYNGDIKSLPDDVNTNENTRILQQLVNIQKNG